MSNPQAGKLFLRIVKRDDVSYDQVKGISGMLSYLHGIQSEEEGTNYKAVKKIMKKTTPDEFTSSKSLKPTSIPMTQALKRAFTTPYNAATGLSKF